MSPILSVSCAAKPSLWCSPSTSCFLNFSRFSSTLFRHHSLHFPLSLRLFYQLQVFSTIIYLPSIFLSFSTFCNTLYMVTSSIIRSLWPSNIFSRPTVKDSLSFASAFPLQYQKPLHLYSSRSRLRPLPPALSFSPYTVNSSSALPTWSRHSAVVSALSPPHSPQHVLSHYFRTEVRQLSLLLVFILSTNQYLSFLGIIHSIYTAFHTSY